MPTMRKPNYEYIRWHLSLTPSTTNRWAIVYERLCYLETAPIEPKIIPLGYGLSRIWDEKNPTGTLVPYSYPNNVECAANTWFHHLLTFSIGLKWFENWWAAREAGWAKNMEPRGGVSKKQLSCFEKSSKAEKKSCLVVRVYNIIPHKEPRVRDTIKG